MICGNRDKTGFNVHYVRTDGYTEGAGYPIITVITERDELERYFDRNKEIYDFTSRATGYSGAATSFADAIREYPDEFFVEHYLVVLILEEGSGSIKHQVEHIEENGDIIIRRILPEIGTADMAEWSILIGLNHGFKPEQFHVLFEDIKSST